MTKLSLIAAIAVSTTMVATAADTTISGKAQAYVYTTDAGTDNLFSDANNQLGSAVTLDVTHALTDNIKANFSAIGFTSLNSQATSGAYMEDAKTGGFFNVANLTGTFGDTTVIAGRQLVSTPMFGGFDWLLAPGAFEAYTVVNKSVDNLTLVGSYVKKWRANDTGDTFTDLTDTNYALGAAYNADIADVSVWYYNIDHAGYTQVYVDAAKTISDFTVAAQFVTTDYDTTTDATAYGVKVSTKISDFDVSVAYNNIQDANTGYVGVDSLYTSSWNTFTSGTFQTGDTDAFKIDASKTFGTVSTTLSYAKYGDDGEEIDLIVGYPVADNISLDAIYSSTTSNASGAKALNGIEVIATYTF